jgi:manganese-transporting P-type ATPase
MFFFSFLKIRNKIDITPISNLPLETLYTLATCHTLVNMEEELIGDPLEKVTLNAIEWSLTKGDVVLAKKPKPIATTTSSSSASAASLSARSTTVGWKIYQRFYFSSALKRMSVIAGHTKPGSYETSYIATCKGAPEIVKTMIDELPANFDEIYLHYAREGSRVLCLGYKELGNLTHQQLRDMTREQVESKLKFVGFVVISCPLKPDSRSVLKEIMHSSHHITMITGDNPLTACHVGAQLKFIDKKLTLVLNREKSNDSSSNDWTWQSIIDESIKKPLDYPIRQMKAMKQSKQIEMAKNNIESYNYLCLTGDVMIN